MVAPLRELRTALLEADVALPVVKSFLARVEERAVGTAVVQGVKPREQLIKLVNDELKEALGGQAVPLATAKAGPTVILLAGLQGAGKTTVAAKLALMLKRQDKSVMLVATDTFRPAAIEQLVKVGAAAGVPVFEQGTRPKPADIARAGVAAAVQSKADVVIIDTAGRVAVNEALMAQLRDVKAATSPTEILLVCDSMLGQDAATAATAFHAALALTGVILTKLDGDSRGGAALSVRASCGQPIKFCGVGEKLEDFEIFYPDRVAGRILGMGDVVSLVEKAAAVTDKADAERLATRMLNNQYDFDDFLTQTEMISKLGPMGNLMKMMPSQFTGGVTMSDSDSQKAEAQLKRFKSMVYSMTPAERRTPALVQASRTRAERIAKGSGRKLDDVAELLQSHGAALAVLHARLPG
jgi:signal recognition particle subunit SRP54